MTGEVTAPSIALVAICRANFDKLSRREAVIAPLSLEGSTSGLLTFNRARHGRQEELLFLEARRLRTILRLTPKVMTLCPIAYWASDRTQLVFILSVLSYVLKASKD